MGRCEITSFSTAGVSIPWFWASVIPCGDPRGPPKPKPGHGWLGRFFFKPGAMFGGWSPEGMFYTSCPAICLARICWIIWIFLIWLVVWLPSIWHFPINIGFISSSLNWRSHIFQRGGELNHQPDHVFIGIFIRNIGNWWGAWLSHWIHWIFPQIEVM